MRKLLSLLLVAATVFAICASMVSCGKSTDAPEGMQLVRGGEDVGYNFYCPEEWTVSNVGTISAAYVSKVDTTSVSLTESEMPAKSFKEYFMDSTARFTFPIEITVNGDVCNFGNAEEAYKFVYSYEYKEIGVVCMQILAKYQGRFYIFTFTSYSAERTEGESYYQFYLEKVQQIIDNVIFTEKKAVQSDPVSYPKDEDGFNLVSDKSVCGFELYLPQSYTVDNSTGIVSASKEDGSFISLTKAMTTGVTIEDYWKLRKENLAPFIDSRTDGEGKTVSTLTEIEVNKRLEGIGNEFAFSFEYTYEYAGVKYHVYQVLFVNGWDGFVFTYTAEEANYESHLEEAKMVLQKVKY